MNCLGAAQPVRVIDSNSGGGTIPPRTTYPDTETTNPWLVIALILAAVYFLGDNN